MGSGLGTLAFLGMPNIQARAGQGADLPHHDATAKRVIYLFQSGGPSHVDLFDYKPALKKLHGTELPKSVRGGQRVTGMTAGQSKFTVNGPIMPVAPRGQSGVTISDLLPYTCGIADEISLVKSVHTEAINHDPGITFINTSSQVPGRPSIGSCANTLLVATTRTCRVTW